jgi:UTP:GlnB (protein PII) uridylyltransferase
MTIGERAEDVFYIERMGGGSLDADAQQRLRDRLIEKLDNRHA